MYSHHVRGSEMKKMLGTKHFLTMLIAVIMVVASVPVQSLAADEEVQGIRSGVEYAVDDEAVPAADTEESAADESAAPEAAAEEPAADIIMTDILGFATAFRFSPHFTKWSPGPRNDMPCPRFIRQGTAESFGRAPACFT